MVTRHHVTLGQKVNYVRLRRKKPPNFYKSCGQMSLKSLYICSYLVKQVIYGHDIVVINDTELWAFCDLGKCQNQDINSITYCICMLCITFII